MASIKNKLSRRQFLVRSAGAVGAAVLTCSGLTVLGVQQPEITFVEDHCGGDFEIKDRILVAYASRYGSTGEVAEAIGKALCDSSSPVDVCLARKAADAGRYRAVVVGSAIHGDEWLPEALDLLLVNRGAFSRVPVAYFLCCKTLREDTAEARREATGYMDAVRRQIPEIKPVATGLFAGKVDPNTFPFFMRLMMLAGGSPMGDWRNWDAIRNWASRLRPMLMQTA
jgi:menaquinone-dependent protoporphyrinogen oxidase